MTPKTGRGSRRTVTEQSEPRVKQEVAGAERTEGRALGPVIGPPEASGFQRASSSRRSCRAEVRVRLKTPRHFPEVPPVGAHEIGAGRSRCSIRVAQCATLGERFVESGKIVQVMTSRPYHSQPGTDIYCRWNVCAIVWVYLTFWEGEKGLEKVSSRQVWFGSVLAAGLQQLRALSASSHHQDVRVLFSS